MASTYTTNTGIELIVTGEQSGTWGDTTNVNLQIIDRLTNGVGAITLSGTTHTLTTSDGVLSDGQYQVLVFGGTPSGTNTVTISPNDQQKVFFAKNESGESVILSQGSGGDVTIANGNAAIVYADGAGAGAAVVDLTAVFPAEGALLAANNLSDVDSAATSRINLGLAIGSDVFAYDANLQGFINAFTLPTSDGTDGQFLATNGSGVLFYKDVETGFTTASTSGATQTIDFSAADIHVSAADAETVTYSFSGASTVDVVRLIVDFQIVGGYSLENASYDSVSFSVTSQDSSPREIAFKDDGTKMYMVGFGSGSVHQYSLSTAWDLSTASYDNVSFGATSQDGSPFSISFKDDGTKLYILGRANDSVYQYSLSTAWDLSTASYDSVSFSVGSQDATPSSISFKDDGTKMYMVGTIGDFVHQYSLSTAWDLSTASYDSVSFSVTSQETSPEGMTFKDDGTKMYISGGNSGSVHQYSLSTAWDLSTASYDSVSFSVTSQDNSPSSISFKDDGTKMYILGDGNGFVYQYSAEGVSSISFPSALEAPSIPIAKNEKTAIEIVTTDGGTTYQATNVQGGIV